MPNILRRNILTAAAVSAPLVAMAGCDLLQLPQGATSFETAKAYANALVNALLEAAAAFMRGPPEPSVEQGDIVVRVMGDLRTAQAALNGASGESGSRAILNQIVVGVGELNPVIAPHLGKAAPYVPLAMAVIQSFIASLPLPPSTPPTPPAALVAASQNAPAKPTAPQALTGHGG